MSKWLPKMLITTKADNRIAKEFFKRYITGAEVSRTLYSIESKSKTKTIGTVTRCFKRWEGRNYLDKGRISKKKGTITAYRLNLKPFFEYANPKIKEAREKKELKLKHQLKNAKDKKLKRALRDLLKGVKEKEFNGKEIKFLEYIFNLPNVREMACKRDTLSDGIMNVLDKIFFYNQIAGKTLVIEIAKAFFAKDKRQLKTLPDHYKQYKEFWKVIIKFLDNLLNKIKDLTEFDRGEYYQLRFNTEINTYSSIPFSIPNYESEENKKKLLRRFEIVFYEGRKPTNQELLDTRMS